MQLEEVEREGQPQRVRRQHQQHQPERPQRREPERPRPGPGLHGRHQCPRRVHRGQHPRDGDDGPGVRDVVAHGLHRGERQQPQQQRVQTQPQRCGDRGMDTFFHDSSSVDAGCAGPVNRKVDVSTGPRAMFPKPADPRLESCSSHGEIFGSPRAGSRSWARSWC